MKSFHATISKFYIQIGVILWLSRTDLFSNDDDLFHDFRIPRQDAFH